MNEAYQVQATHQQVNVVQPGSFDDHKPETLTQTKIALKHVPIKGKGGVSG